MKLLAVETATEACSVALYIEGIVTERFELTPKEHTRLILPMIDSLMADCGIKAATTRCSGIWLWPRLVYRCKNCHRCNSGHRIWR